MGFVSLFLAGFLFWQREVFDQPFNSVLAKKAGVPDDAKWQEQAESGKQIMEDFEKEVKKSKSKLQTVNNASENVEGQA